MLQPQLQRPDEAVGPIHTFASSLSRRAPRVQRGLCPLRQAAVPSLGWHPSCHPKASQVARQGKMPMARRSQERSSPSLGSGLDRQSSSPSSRFGPNGVQSACHPCVCCLAGALTYSAFASHVCVAGLSTYRRLTASPGATS